MHWLFLGFLSFFPVASPPHSVLEGCADPSGSLNKQELRAGCHHPCSFSAHSCWGTIHQANRLEEAQELSELPVWNKSYYWMRTSHTHFFSTSLLGQSLQSFSMEWEVVGFSATFLMLRKLEMARNVRCGSAQALAGNASCRSVVHVLAGLGGHNQKFSAVIYKHLERKKKVLAFYNLGQASTSLYVIPYLRITEVLSLFPGWSWFFPGWGLPELLCCGCVSEESSILAKILKS